eukprot:SAG11_NODE_1528_length_4739_cov_2.858190_3_plen_51_part_00
MSKTLVSAIFACAVRTDFDHCKNLTTFHGTLDFGATSIAPSTSALTPLSR